MPRRRPRNIDVTRFELGDYERQQLSDIKWAMAAPGLGILGAGAAIGAGIYFGAMFFNNTLDEVREYLSTWWDRNIGIDEETKAAVQDAIGETTMEGDTYTYDLPEWAEGMSVYAAYDLCKEWEAEIFEAQYERWLTAQGLQHSFEHRKYWRQFNRSPFTQRITNAIDDEIGVSPFAYQLLIRETAARRRQGKVASLLGGTGVGSLLGPAGAWAGAGVASAVWLAGDAIGALGNNWTGDWATSAPGFIDDPLLWVAWLRTDFPGVDAVPGTANPDDINSGLDFETWLYDTHLEQASDPSDLRTLWPSNPYAGYVDVGWVSPKVDPTPDTPWTTQDTRTI